MALLGVLKAGGAYVPLDPALPARAAGAACWRTPAPPVLVTQRARCRGACRAGAAAVVCLDARRGRRSRPSAGDAAGAPADAGQPGLRHLHLGLDRPAQGGRRCRTAALVNFLALDGASGPGSAPGDALLAVTSLVLRHRRPGDLSCRCSRGAPAWSLAAARTAADGAAAGGAARRRAGVTVLQATPATWRLLLEAGWRGGARACAALVRRRGAAARRWPTRLYAPAAVERLLNLYGPTEATTYVDLRAVSTAAATRRAADRPADRQHARLRAGPRGCEPVPVGRARRAAASAARAWRAATWAGRS